jgi:hypothetical protein
MHWTCQDTKNRERFCCCFRVVVVRMFSCGLCFTQVLYVICYLYAATQAMTAQSATGRDTIR